MWSEYFRWREEEREHEVEESKRQRPKMQPASGMRGMLKRIAQKGKRG